MFRWIAGEAARQARHDGRGVPVLFALFWTGFIGFVCVVMARGAVRQVAAAGWPTADGVVTVSELVSRKKGSGHWTLAYEYAVAGRAYTGTRYAHDPMPIQGPEEVRRHVAAYPVGAAVVVHYNPDDPADAVLRPGLRGCTLWVALCLTPFVVVGLGMWAGIVRRGRPGFDPNDPRQVAETDAGVVVRPDRTGWPAVFLTYLGIVAFAVAWVVFGVGFALGAAYWVFDGFLLDPPIEAPAAVWAAVLAGCGLAAWRAARRPPALVLDTVGRRLVVAAGGRATEIPFAEVCGVSVGEGPHPLARPPAVRHRVEVDRTRDDPLVVAEYDDPDSAAALADWLRGRLGVRPAAG